MKNLLKYITTGLFFGFIFIIPLVTLATPDKKISEVENKILTQFPKLSFSNIISKRFMNEFDKYSSDQFPLRSNFIETKNLYSYLTGQREFRNIYVGKTNRLMEKFTYNKDRINNNLNILSQISNLFGEKFGINTKLMIIPTSIAFYEDELPYWAITDSEKAVIDYIDLTVCDFKYLDFYSPYEILYKNKEEYIYFDTDHHWTQLGAKLAYEDMYNTKVPYDAEKVSNSFYGSYYSKAILPNISGDSIYAYTDFSNYKIEIDLVENYDTLYAEDKLKGKNKYQYFLHGDPAFAIVEGNPNINDEILIFKDSYAHSFIPFLTSHYSKIHIIDPRYYTTNYEDYLSKNQNISEVLFINNIQTFNSTPILNN